MSDLTWFVHTQIIPAALSLLPAKMNSLQARAMLIAIGLQESGFNARAQGGHGTVKGTGPASGFWMFEKAGGVTEVLTDLQEIVAPICRELLYQPTPGVIHPALADNWVLAAVFARLLLWKDPRSMPESNNPKKGWAVYRDRWQPGKPGPDRWPGNFATAWTIVRE